ncbi:MAG: carbohydrate ABC transporter permease [Roseburia sp.]|nr:carbohydrate ABC transporter permease [Roseburia sp.]MCM1098476.1 carbohydrate ABC transporter permease [Ruminococcus flavefaciens]
MRKKKIDVNDDNRVSSMVEHPSVGDRIVDIIVILLCALVAFCSLVPMWHVLMSSFSDGKILMTHEGVAWLPQGGFTLAGYRHIFKDSSIITGYLNTILYTVSSTALGFFIACTAGYAMSRDTRLKTVMIMAMMVTMLFGGGMVPTYMVIRKLGWVGTRLALIIPGCTNAMFMVMMMNAFNSVPREMYEAARIDGAGHFRTMSQIMLPQAMNLGSVIILNSVVGQWNSWLQASIYVPNKRNLWPLQLYIKEITANNENFLQSSNPDYSRYLIRYAVIVAATLPIVILFPFFQDKLEKGVIAGGIKG